MNADMEQLALDAMTSKIIASAYRVANTLGAGYLEKVYENAMAVDLRMCGLQVSQQTCYPVRYRGEVVGEYIPDLVVADSVIVEIKAVDLLGRVHQAQVMNYLKTTGLPVALLFNFAKPHLEFKRLVWGF